MALLDWVGAWQLLSCEYMELSGCTRAAQCRDVVCWVAVAAGACWCLGFEGHFWTVKGTISILWDHSICWKSDKSFVGDHFILRNKLAGWRSSDPAPRRIRGSMHWYPPSRHLWDAESHHSCPRGTPAHNQRGSLYYTHNFNGKWKQKHWKRVSLTFHFVSTFFISDT